MTSFKLDPRLEADTFAVGALELCDVRLMNDRRWPWLVLVPRVDGVNEIHELTESLQMTLAHETALAASLLKQITRHEKINSAALGNIVRQLHVHVVARSAGDPNWPRPVWGFGQRETYEPADAAALIERVFQGLTMAQQQSAEAAP